MRFSLPSIECSAAPPSFRLLSSAVRIRRFFYSRQPCQASSHRIKIWIWLLCNIDFIICFSIIRFSNEEWNIQTKTWSHTWFTIRLIHGTGTWEFEYWNGGILEFHFEYFILRSKSGLLNRIDKLIIAIINFKCLFNWSTLELTSRYELCSAVVGSWEESPKSWLTAARKTHLSVELWILESACYWKAQ